MKFQHLLIATFISAVASPLTFAQPSNQPANTRSWEAVPSVIRSNGIDSFQLKVSVTSPVQAIYIEADTVSPYLVAPESLVLRDDGIDGDDVAGDLVYTSGKFRYNMAYLLPQYYMHSADSPAGLYSTSIGMVTFEELDGRISDFLLAPEIGLLNQNIVAVSTKTHSDNLATSPNLINIKSSDRATQNYLRLYPGSGLNDLTKEIYRVLPDDFDFLVFYSNDKIESQPHQTTTANYHAGMHSTVQVNYSGTGNTLSDYSHLYGSQGRLLGVNALDTFSRGMNSDNAVHELLHQWSAALNKSLGLGDHSSHYNPRSNIGSVLGATFPWLDNNDGTYRIDCETGKNGLSDAAPLDKYLMGFIDGREVPTLRAYKKSKAHPADLCRRGENHIDTDDLEAEVSIEDIQSQHGIRTPGPTSAKRDFNIGFVVESHGRFLTATEMTYYSIMSAHFTRQLSPSEAAPAVSTRNWVSITKYFGEGSTWSSAIATHNEQGKSETDAVTATASRTVNTSSLMAATARSSQAARGSISLRGALAVAMSRRNASLPAAATTRSVSQAKTPASTVKTSAPTTTTTVTPVAEPTATKVIAPTTPKAETAGALAVVVAPQSLFIEAEKFKAMHGVKIQNGVNSDKASGAVVSEIDADDWMRYSVNINSAGTYTIEYRVASTTTNGYFALDTSADLSGSNMKIVDNVSVPSTGGSMKWQTISRSVKLEAGLQNLGVYAYGGGFNLDWIRITFNPEAQ